MYGLIKKEKKRKENTFMYYENRLFDLPDQCQFTCFKCNTMVAEYWEDIIGYNKCICCPPVCYKFSAACGCNDESRFSLDGHYFDDYAWNFEVKEWTRDSGN